MKFAYWECQSGTIKDLPIVDPRRTSFQSPFGCRDWLSAEAFKDAIVISGHWNVWCLPPRPRSEKRLYVNMFCLICTRVEQAWTGTSIKDDKQGPGQAIAIPITILVKCGCLLVLTVSGLPLTCFTSAAPSRAITHHNMGITSPKAVHCLHKKASEICICDSLRDPSIKPNFSAPLPEPSRCLLHMCVYSDI